MLITIDGPAGSGKSTAARELAKELGLAYLDTGATYRAVTLAALRRGADLTDQPVLAELAAGLDLRVVPNDDGMLTLLDGQDVSADIRTAEVTDNAHYIAGAPPVREILVRLQRRIGGDLAARAGGLVAEGRDQGSVVFPEAEVKFYLDASAEVRARRRCDEMVAAGQQAAYEDVLNAITARDGRDRRRPVAPLIKPPGAIEIDTTEMTIPEVTAELARLVRVRG